MRAGRREGQRLQKGVGPRGPRGRGCGVGSAGRGGSVSGGRRDPRGERRGDRGGGDGSALKGPNGGAAPRGGYPGGRKRRLWAEETRGGGEAPTDGTRDGGWGRIALRGRGPREGLPLRNLGVGESRRGDGAGREGEEGNEGPSRGNQAGGRTCAEENRETEAPHRVRQGRRGRVHAEGTGVKVQALWLPRVIEG